MTYDIVHHPDQEELAIDEALRRLVTSFPRVLVDRPRGIALRRSWGSKCGSYIQIDPTSYCNPDCEILAAWVSIEVENGAEAVEFVLEHKMEFFFEYSSDDCRQLRRPAIQRVADVLGYAISEWCLLMNVTVEYVNGLCPISPFIGEELTFIWRLGEALSRYDLYAEEISFGSECLKIAVIVNDDEVGKRCVEEAVLSLLPYATIKFAFQPNELPRCC